MYFKIYSEIIFVRFGIFLVDLIRACLKFKRKIPRCVAPIYLSSQLSSIYILRE